MNRDDATQDDLEAAQRALSARWLRPGALAASAGGSPDRASPARNVHGVGIGRKWVAGKETEVPCVRLHVLRKWPRADLSPRHRLPADLDGVPTDVIVSPPARAQTRPPPALPPAGVTSCTRGRRGPRRPLLAGVSVAHYAVSAGTIAAFCRGRHPEDGPGDVFLLSNNHVLADLNRGAPADDVLQPGPFDGGTAIDHVADLARFVPIRLGGRARNRVDAALARLRADVAWRPEVCSVGPVRGLAPSSEGLFVRKHGRTTGLTEGRITDVAYDALVGMDDEDPDVEALFVDQLRLASRGLGPVGLGGDSGSLVVTIEKRPRAVGLYFAGPEDGSYGVANPIETVLRLLEAELLP